MAVAHAAVTAGVEIIDVPDADSAVAEAAGPTLVTGVAGTEAVDGLVVAWLVVAAVPTGSVAGTGTFDGTVVVIEAVVAGIGTVAGTVDETTAIAVLVTGAEIDVVDAVLVISLDLL